MKLKLCKIRSGDKLLTIIDEDNQYGLLIYIDYDDVDQETVIKDAKELISRVNSFNS